MFQQTKDNEDEWFGSNWTLREKKTGSEAADPKKYWNSGTDQYRELVEELQAVSVSSTETITATDIAKSLAEAVEKGGTKFKDLVDALKTHGKLNSAKNANDLAGNNNGLNKQEVNTAIKDLIKAEFDVTVETTQINATPVSGAENNKVTVTIGSESSGAKTAIVSGLGTTKNIELVFNVQVNKDKNQNIANRLKKAAENWNPGKELVKGEFGAPDSANVTQDTSPSELNKVKVDAGGGSGTNSSSPEKVSVEITGSSGELNFESLVCLLSETTFTGTPENVANTLAGKFNDTVNTLSSALSKLPKENLLRKQFTEENGDLKDANKIATQLGGSETDKVAKLLLKQEFGLDTNATISADKTQVTVNAGVTSSSGRGNASVTVKKDGETSDSQVSIIVENAKTVQQANAIASALALALVNPMVKEAAKKSGFTISLGSSDTSEVKIKVTNAISNAVARRIARRLAHSLKDKVTSISMGTSGLISALNTEDVKKIIAKWVKGVCGATVSDPNSNIIISEDTGTGKIKVTLSGGGLQGTNEGESDQAVAQTSKNVKVEISLSSKGWLKETGDNGNNSKEASKIANKIAKAVALGALANKLYNGGINSESSLTTGQLAGNTTGLNNTEVKNAIRDLVKIMYKAEVNETTSDISAIEEPSSIPNILKVELSGSSIAGGTGSIGLDFHNNEAGKGVKVTINISTAGILKTQNGGGTKDTTEAAGEIARRLAKAARKAATGDTYNPGNELLHSKMEFGIENATVTADGNNNQVTVSAGGGESKTEPPIKVKITGSGEKFDALVKDLAPKVGEHLKGELNDQGKIAEALKDALNGVKTQIQDMIQTDFKVTETVTVSNSGATVQVKIGSSASQSKGTASVLVNSKNITIQVMGEGTTPTEAKGKAIANALALALLDQRVVKAAKEKNKDVTISLDGGKQPEVEIQVDKARSTAQANRIAFKLGSALTKVTSVTGFPVLSNTLKTAIENNREALSRYINFKYWSSIDASNIEASTDGTSRKVTVEIKESVGASTQGTGVSDADVVQSGGQVKVTITVNQDNKGGLDTSKNTHAQEIANKIACFVAVAALTNQISGSISSKENLNASALQTALSGAKNPYLKNLVQGYNGADVADPSSGIDVQKDAGNNVAVTFGKSTKFKELVSALENQVKQELASLSDPSSAKEIADKLYNVLNNVKNNHLKQLAESMVDASKVGKVGSVDVSQEGNKVTVKISDTTGQKYITYNLNNNW